MSENGSIPFLDLVSLHDGLEEELISVFQRVLKTAGFIGGPMVNEFEREFSFFCDAKHCVGVASGTDALRFALMAAGVRHGDVVVTVPHTFFATTEAISQAGARPDFVDIDERTHGLDADELRRYFERECEIDCTTGRPVHRRWNTPVTAVVPVHIYGQVVDMDPILELAGKYNLIVVEDACQAHGAEYFSKVQMRWRKAGSMGDAAAFSFYPGKNLGACGEAGAVTTNSEKIAHQIRLLRDHGQSRKYYHDVEGYNGRLDAIQAGILQVKLGHLSEWNRLRREAAMRYHDLLDGVGPDLTLPQEPSWSRSVYHLYVIRTTWRDALKEFLRSAGIGTGIHYPIPVHLQDAYRSMGFRKGDFPVAEKVAAEVLSLPMFPGLGRVQQRRVAEEIAHGLRVAQTGFRRESPCQTGDSRHPRQPVGSHVLLSPISSDTACTSGGRGDVR
jgi:dTDP-4-amino-4,6-dideoxygalactose transaminase